MAEPNFRVLTGRIGRIKTNDLDFSEKRQGQCPVIANAAAVTSEELIYCLSIRPK